MLSLTMNCHCKLHVVRIVLNNIDVTNRKKYIPQGKKKRKIKRLKPIKTNWNVNKFHFGLLQINLIFWFQINKATKQRRRNDNEMKKKLTERGRRREKERERTKKERERERKRRINGMESQEVIEIAPTSSEDGHSAETPSVHLMVTFYAETFCFQCRWATILYLFLIYAIHTDQSDYRKMRISPIKSATCWTEESCWKIELGLK